MSTYQIHTSNNANKTTHGKTKDYGTDGHLWASANNLISLQGESTGNRGDFSPEQFTYVHLKFWTFDHV